MTTEFVRWHGQPWLPEGQWARQLAGAIGRASIQDIAERLHGVFAVVRASREGDVTVFADPLGHRCVYYGETDDVIAVSSKARSVAEMLESDIRRPASRSSQHLLARLLRSSHWERHRFRGCTTAASRRQGGDQRHRHDRGSPRSAVDARRCLARHDRDDLIDLMRDGIADSLRATLDLPVDRHVLRLTGGKDSRLLLAVAQWAGLAKDFHHETIGPPSLPDVQIASELAEIYKLRHEVRFIGLGS